MRAGLALLLLAGCAGTSPDEAPPAPEIPNAARAELEALEAPFRAPGVVTARLGQTVRLGGVEIRPLEVLEDSRCPRDVDCVWAGRIRLKVRVGGGGEPVMELDRPVALPDGRGLRLVAAFPPRWHNPPSGIDPRAPLRFAFRLDP